MRSGTAYRHRPLAPLTDEIGSGLLPTPTVQDGHNHGAPSQHNRKSLALNVVIQYLPTPRAGCARGTAGPDFAKEDRKRPDGKGSGGDDLLTLLERIRRQRPRKSKTIASGQFSLDGEPLSPPSETSPTEPPPSGALLSPSFVEWMQGFPSGWTELMHSATRSALSSRNGLASASGPTKRGSRRKKPRATS